MYIQNRKEWLEVDDYDKMYKAIFVYLLEMKIGIGRGETSVGATW